MGAYTRASGRMTCVMDEATSSTLMAHLISASTITTSHKVRASSRGPTTKPTMASGSRESRRALASGKALQESHMLASGTMAKSMVMV